jgi:hypothetical protein
MTNVEIAKKQAEFVKSKLREMKDEGNCQGVILADYTREEYEKILPGENWDEYVETQFLFMHYLNEAGIGQEVQFQHIDYDGLMEFCAEKGIKNDAATRSWYAVVKYGRENIKK